MVIVDSINVTPNPVDVGKTVTVTVKLHEEYPDVKKYKYDYPYRYGKQK